MAIATIAIMDAFATRLETILVSNGYRTGIGASVTRGRFTIRADSTLAACAVMLLPRTSEQTSAAHDRSRVAAQLRIEAHHYYASDQESEVIGQNMLADIQQAVEIEPFNLGGLLQAEGFSWAGDEIIYPEDISNVVSVVMDYDIPHIRYTGEPERPAL